MLILLVDRMYLPPYVPSKEHFLICLYSMVSATGTSAGVQVTMWVLVKDKLNCLASWWSGLGARGNMGLWRRGHGRWCWLLKRAGSPGHLWWAFYLFWFWKRITKPICICLCRILQKIWIVQCCFPNSKHLPYICYTYAFK